MSAKPTDPKPVPVPVQARNPPDAVRIRPLSAKSVLLMGRGYPLFVPAKGARDANGKPGPGYVDVEVERAKRYAHDLGIAVRRGKVAVESVDAGVVSPISPEDFAVWVAANDAGPIHKPAPARAATG